MPQSDDRKHLEKQEYRSVAVAEIDLEQLTKVYPDGTRAVNELDLEIADGEFAVLVGPSGCGKTTALRMVAALEPITSGEVRIGGRVVNDLPPKNRDVAMVFQNYALYPHMSAYKNMAFGLKLRNIAKSEIDRRVKDAARVLGLGEVLGKRPRTLSGGQRQRVAMGRAIVREPQAFLMDEPLSNLDAKLRVEMRAEIARIQRDLEVTTIYVTHDQTEALTLGDRVAVLRDGVLQQFDVPQRLYDEPVNLFVAEFIGSPATNLVGADLVRENGRLEAKFGEHRLAVADELLQARPALGGFEGRRLILGIRPEDFTYADREADGQISAPVDIREDMGSEVFVHFAVDGPPVHGDRRIKAVGSESQVRQPGADDKEHGDPDDQAVRKCERDPGDHDRRPDPELAQEVVAEAAEGQLLGQRRRDCDREKAEDERADAVGLPARRVEPLLLAGVEDRLEDRPDDEHRDEQADRQPARALPRGRALERERLAPVQAAGDHQHDPDQQGVDEQAAEPELVLVDGVRPIGVVVGGSGGQKADEDEGAGQHPPGEELAPERLLAGTCELRLAHATHCQRAHCADTTPSNTALTTTTPVCRRGREPSTASAMKNGKTTSPKRWIESSGQRSDGTLSGIARLSAAKSPYGAPNWRQARTVSPAKRTRNASCARLIAATRSGSASWTALQYRVVSELDTSCLAPAQPARSPSQSPPSGPAGESSRLQVCSARRKANGSPSFHQR